MILNDKQHDISKTQLDKFKSAISNFDFAERMNLIGSEILVQAEYNALISQAEELQHNINEYSKLKDGEFDSFSTSDTSALPLLLIKSRISQNITQKFIADNLEITELEFLKIEDELYYSKNTGFINKVCDLLHISYTDGIYSYVPPLDSLSQRDQIPYEDFPFKEMLNRGWFDDIIESSNLENINKEEVINKFIDNINNNQINEAARQCTRINGIVNPCSLFAWKCRIIQQAQKQSSSICFSKDLITPNWIRGLAQLSINNNIQEVSNYLSEIGIILVIEPHLQHTHLDGGAFLTEDHKPIIGMTIRYDRIDNFWFVLMHEIGHIYLHLSEDITTGVFDDFDSDGNEIEDEADNFALNSLIPDEDWAMCPARFMQTKEVILNFAEEMNIHPAIVAGRIRNETNNYTNPLLSGLVGNRQIRIQFPNISF